MLPVNDISLPNPFDPPRRNGPAASAYQTPPESPTLPLRPTVVHQPYRAQTYYPRQPPGHTPNPAPPPRYQASTQHPRPAQQRPHGHSPESMSQAPQAHRPP